MKKVIIVTALLSTAVLTYQLLSDSIRETSIIEQEKILEAPKLQEETLIFDDKELDQLDKLEEDLEADFKPLPIEKRKEPVTLEKEEAEKEVKDIMVEADIEEVKEHFPTKRGIKPLIAITLPQKTISHLDIGDKVSLPYMGAGEYEATITTKTTHKNGSVTVSGNIDDLGKGYSVLLTEGKSMSFGTVTTPDGTFEIESKNGEGYIYSTKDIDKRWIDYSKSDTLKPHPH